VLSYPPASKAASWAGAFASELAWVCFVFLSLACLGLAAAPAASGPKPGPAPAAKIGVSATPTAEEHMLRGCSPRGWGDDLELNRQKNRVIPVVHPEAMTVAQINGLPLQFLPGKRSHWTAREHKEVAQLESIGAVVTGYIVGVGEERMEATNCYRPDLYDLHMWIAASPDTPKSKAMIAEITPRWENRYREWRLWYLKRLMRAHVRVRLTGWLMLDDNHPDQIGRTRGGVWELHPVTAIWTAPGLPRRRNPLTAGGGAATVNSSDRAGQQR
jgi:hypothetical protein